MKNRFVYLKDKKINNVEHHFLLLHYFDSSNGNLFTSDEEVLRSFKPNKYSILGYFDDSFSISNKFVFLLEYPDVDCAYYFQQDFNPLKTTHDQQVNMVNKGLSCPEEGSRIFSGFTRFQSPDLALMDGIISNHIYQYYWFFPIGQREKYGNNSTPVFLQQYQSEELNYGLKLKTSRFFLGLENISHASTKNIYMSLHFSLFLFFSRKTDIFHDNSDSVDNIF